MLAALVTTNANAISYLYVFRVAALLFVATIPLLALLPDPRAVRREPTGDVDVEVADELAERRSGQVRLIPHASTNGVRPSATSPTIW